MKKILLVALGILPTFTLALPPPPPPPPSPISVAPSPADSSSNVVVSYPVVVLSSNKSVKGISTSTAQAFLGLRYAQAPTGNGRFRPTLTPEPSWSGSYDATQAKSVCAQMAISKDGSAPSYKGSEDCLFLNIYRPNSFSGKIPVMVFIHGGGYIGGSGSDPIYNGSTLAKAGNVIVVSFNYRLGTLGFLAHPALTSRLGFPSGNFGFYDQIAALQWVKNNIASFGGDVNQVTLFGESAGAASVLQLSTSPKAAGLFNRAIIESTFAEIKTQQQAERLGASIASNARCTGSNSQILNCLLSTSAQNLVSTQDSTGAVFVHEYRWHSINGPVLDGIVFNKGPMDAIAAGQVNPSALLIGGNSGDGVVGMSEYKQGAESGYGPGEFMNSLSSAFGAQVGSKLGNIYNPLQYSTLGDAIMTVRTDFDMACSTRQIARALKKVSGKSVRRYVFDGMFLGLNQNFLKLVSGIATVSMPVDFSIFSIPFPAFHGIDVPYEFQNIAMLYEAMSQQSGMSVNPTSQDTALQSIMGAYWLNFAKSANPNGSGQSNWPEYNATSDTTQRLASPISTLNGYHSVACDVYDSLYPNDQRQ